jgi:hypothetical protein
MPKVVNYIQSWILHIERMPDERIPKQVLKHKPKGNRSVGRLGKV